MEQRAQFEATDDVLALMRPAATLMKPERLAAHWQTRLSFARRLLRRMCRERWRIVLSQLALDANGNGEVMYTIRTGRRPLYAVFFSTVLDESERDDRVIAERWDIAGALTDRLPDEQMLTHMRVNVPRQEYGRALPTTMVWTRGNRSSRYFDYVVDQLASGQQPDVPELAKGGYLVRSTAYYGNAKFGLTAYEAIPGDHPVHGSFMPQMLMAFVLREFSCDLVDHLASARDKAAVRLAPAIRRFLGIGNATGMGLVPFVINHPHITHQWVWLRELALAEIRTLTVPMHDEQIGKCIAAIENAQHYCQQDTTDDKGLFASASVLNNELAGPLQKLRLYQAGDLAVGWHAGRFWHQFMVWVEDTFQLETQEMLTSILLEIYPSITDKLENGLEVSERFEHRPDWTVAQLRQELALRYQWALEWATDAASHTHFWYFSEDSEEPLIGTRGIDAGEAVARPLDIPQRVQALSRALAGVAESSSLGRFLARHPEHRFIVARIQSTTGLKYAEIETNLMGIDCIPLHLQRFQLAMYGMARFNPQSTKWVRVTLMQGAPTAADVAAGGDPDWFLPLVSDFEVVHV